MTSFPPVPPFPPQAYALPYGKTIDPSHVLQVEPPGDDFSVCDVGSFLNCLITSAFLREGCDWLIVANRKVYYAKWRDVSVLPPWTRQVWDLYRVGPVVCGCPSNPLSLGWQWCWSDMIETIRCDVLQHWQYGDVAGSGGTVVNVGTNYFQAATVGVPQAGPVLHLNAAEASSLDVAGGGVERWRDLSTLGNDAVQDVPLERPTIEPSSLNGIDTVRFDGSAQFMNITLRRRADWHLFVVGRYFLNLAQPRGTFLGAMGFEDSYGGLEGKVYQDSSVSPAGTPFTYVTGDVPLLGTTLGAGVFGIWEWNETIGMVGNVHIGVNGFDRNVLSTNTSNDYWDPTRQTFGQPIPIPGSLGRSNWGLNPGRTYDYLDGNIAEVLLYPRVLGEGERTQVLNVLRARWGLGPPLPVP